MPALVARSRFRVCQSTEISMKKFHLIALTAAGLLMSGAAFAADECAAEIESNDVMQYNKSSIVVPASCKEFTVTLKHVGKMPKTTMGHNWALALPADQKALLAAGLAAGAAKDYIPADDKLIAHTKLIGGGESASATFAVAKLKAGENYAYFCTFPGHAALMKGTLSVK
jgi:azurin